MKKIIPAGLCLLLALLVYVPGQAFAGSRLTVFGSDSGIDKSIPAVSDKLLQEFHESFPNAERVNWEETDKRFVVSFVEQGISNRITYKKNGDFISSFRNYGERDLPYYLVSSLKKKFSGQKIFGITEVTTVSDITYFVKLEGPKDWITVSVDSEGTSSVVESYSKAL
jgi:hypothetical protein